MYPLAAKMSTPTTTDTTPTATASNLNNFLVLLPFTQARFDASGATSSAITEAISMALNTEEKTQLSRSTAFAALDTSDEPPVVPTLLAEPVPVTAFAKEGFLRLGN